MNIINFKHSIIFFNLSILLIPFYLMLDYEPLIVCLFIILIIGVSHGSLDHIKGYKLMKFYKINNRHLFYPIYI